MSIEYGLCEKLNHKAIPAEVAPMDWNSGFNITDLESILPTGSTDHSVKPIYEEVQTKLGRGRFYFLLLVLLLNLIVSCFNISFQMPQF